MKPEPIRRFTFEERSNHWLVAIVFFLLALSGLALFHPALYWLSALFGGGPWTRILHPFLGVLMVLSFAALALRVGRDNRWTANDSQWFCQLRDVLDGRDENLPPVGRFNGGEKVLFKVMATCVALLLLTGIAVWRPYFAPALPIGAVRVAVLVHAFVAWVLMLAVVIHVYAAIWVKGSLRGMTRGTVTAAWARKHHLAWYRDMGGDH